MNTKSTKDSINNFLVPFLHDINYEKNKILWDNAPCHTSREMRDFIESEELRFFPPGSKNLDIPHGYPPNSPDINIIENIFGYWSDQVILKSITLCIHSLKS